MRKVAEGEKREKNGETRKRNSGHYLIDSRPHNGDILLATTCAILLETELHFFFFGIADYL